MTHPESTQPEELRTPDAELVEALQELVQRGERHLTLAAVIDMFPADLAQILVRLPEEKGQQLFHWLSDEQAGDVLAELKDAFRGDLLEDAPRERLTAMLDELDTDDAADVIADLPEALGQEILPTLKEHEEVEELLQYDEESAGGIMGAEYVAVPQNITVSEATEEVRRNAETVEVVYALFALDEDEKLAGVVSLRRLLLSPADTRITEIMNKDVISVPTNLDQEEVALIMEKYNLVSLPVVDPENRLAGQITIDDIVDVIRDEAEEDMMKMSGVRSCEEPTDSVLHIVAGRLPWLLAGLIGAGLAALVIGSFQHALREATLLAVFIPIVMATAGNAGIQSSAIAVQGLATGDVWLTDISRRLSKELRVALLNGVVAACVLGVAILLIAQVYPLTRPVELAGTAALSLVLVIVLATCIGASIPLLLEHLKIDPAIATGPFITTSNDIMGILIFFLLADWIYL
ncbi:MAG: magnesium transporter [Verrucomicrobiota bacterium]